MVRQTGIILLFVCVLGARVTGCVGAQTVKKVITDSIPVMFRGSFMDDYSIGYTITDTLWTQHPNIKYHIIAWDTAAQYLLARNDDKNPSERGLYTRIDYMRFSGMEPFLWGFCLTTYNAKSIEEARTKARADRENPRKGCGGYPFSRMKRVE